VFERFTPAARTVVVGAQDQARAVGAARIEPAHVLLALLQDRTGPHANLLSSSGVDPGVLAAVVRRVAGAAAADPSPAPGPVRPTADNGGAPASAPAGDPRGDRFAAVSITAPLPFAADAEQVLVQAGARAAEVGAHHVGTEHLLAGLLAVQGQLIGELLMEAGLVPSLDDFGARLADLLARHAS
jgi:ATP-dependent Clp protease ATP-binding subunit ClpA